MAQDIAASVEQLTHGVAHLVTQNRQSIATGLNKFSGTDKENPVTFLDSFNAHATFCGWQVATKRNAFPLALTGAASIWFSRLNDDIKQDWALLQAAFQAEYVTKQARDILHTIQRRKMYSTETVSAYATHMQELFSRINRPEADLVYYFIEGLLPEYRKHVMMQSPETVTRAITLAKTAERASNRVTLDTNEPVNDQLTILNSAVKDISARLSTLGGKLDTHVNTLSQGDNQTMNQKQGRTQRSNARVDRTMAGRPKCFRCGLVGHLSYSCRAITCHNCGLPGHISPNCRRQQQNSNPRPTQPGRQFFTGQRNRNSQFGDNRVGQQRSNNQGYRRPFNSFEPNRSN